MASTAMRIDTSVRFATIVRLYSVVFATTRRDP
jgi:hypothetical protein